MRIRFAKWVCDRLTKDADFGKKNHLFKWRSFWSWAGIHWRTHAPKTSRILVLILIQKHNWAIFLRKWIRIGRYSQWRSLSGNVKRIFVHKNWRGGYWQHLVSIGRRYVSNSLSYTQCFAPCFWRSYYQPQSWCHLATSELRFDTVEFFCNWCLFLEWKRLAHVWFDR